MQLEEQDKQTMVICVVRLLKLPDEITPLASMKPWTETRLSFRESSEKKLQETVADAFGFLFVNRKHITLKPVFDEISSKIAIFRKLFMSENS